MATEHFLLTPTKKAASTLTSVEAKKPSLLDPEALTSARKARGYLKRSINLYLKKTGDYIKELAAQPDNAQLKSLVEEQFKKAKTNFESFEQQHSIIMGLVKEADEEKEFEAYEEVFDFFSAIEKQLIEISANVADLNLTGQGDKTAEPSSAAKVPSMPSQRFKGPIPPEEAEVPAEMSLMLRALYINYKVTDHVTPFDGTDPMLYTAFRYQFESADRVMTKMANSDFEKFLELKKCLKAEPLKLVEHLPDCDQSYNRALAILDNFFVNSQTSINKITRNLQDLPKMTHNLASVKGFYTELTSLYHAMQALGLNEDAMGISLFLSNVVPKLSNVCCREWLKIQQKNKADTPLGHSCTIEDLLECVLFQLQLLQQLDDLTRVDKAKALPEKSTFKKAKNQQAQGKPQQSLPRIFLAQEKKPFKCDFCDKLNHSSLNCANLKNMNPNQVFEVANKKRLCKLCLRANHKTADCKRSEQLCCSICKKRHNTLLHLPNLGIRKNPAIKLVMRTRTENEDQAIPIPHLIKVGISAVNSKLGAQRNIYCLLDSGSNINLIKDSLVEELRLNEKATTAPNECEVLGGLKVPFSGTEVKFRLYSLMDGYRCIAAATKIPHIAVETARLEFEKAEFPHLANYPISLDLPRSEPIDIDILIGEPCYSVLMVGVKGRCQCSNAKCCPTLWLSRLGYFLGGAFLKNNHDPSCQGPPKWRQREY